MISELDLMRPFDKQAYSLLSGFREGMFNLSLSFSNPPIRILHPDIDTKLGLSVLRLDGFTDNHIYTSYDMSIPVWERIVVIADRLNSDGVPIYTEELRINFWRFLPHFLPRIFVSHMALTEDFKVENSYQTRAVDKGYIMLRRLIAH